MRENYFQQPGLYLAKPPNQNNHLTLNQVNLYDFKNRNRSFSIKNDESAFFQSPLKINGIRKIELIPSTNNYKTDTFNSHNQSQPKISIIDTMSEKSDIKDIPISKEKKNISLP